MKPPRVFRKLGAALEIAIPKAIERASAPRPLWSVRLYYYDTHAPCSYLFLGTISVQQRDKLIAKHGALANERLWSPHEVKTDGPPSLCLPSDQPPPWPEFLLAWRFSSVYRLLGRDEEAYMVHYRDMLRTVAQKLTTAKWPAACETTDDFTVVPADGSQYFWEDEQDVVYSVPESRRRLLQSRGYLRQDDQLLATTEQVQPFLEPPKQG
jgi:hypothetical protein